MKAIDDELTYNITPALIDVLSAARSLNADELIALWLWTGRTIEALALDTTKQALSAEIDEQAKQELQKLRRHVIGTKRQLDKMLAPVERDIDALEKKTHQR